MLEKSDFDLNNKSYFDLSSIAWIHADRDRLGYLVVSLSVVRIMSVQV